MKPNKYQKDFSERLVRVAERLFNEGESELGKMLKNIAENNNIINNYIGKIMLKYNIVDQFMDMSPVEIKKELKSISSLITQTFKAEIKGETSHIKSFLTYVGHSTWDNSSSILKMGIDFKLKKVKSEVLKNIINKTIKGKIYSDRIKHNKNQIAKILNKEIQDFLEGKTSVNEIEKKIRNLYNNDKKATSILVRNEIGRVQAGVNEKWAEEHDIQWQLYSATLDSKTSKMCRKWDGKVFRLDDSNKPIPNVSTHICCRSCLTAIPDKDWRPSKRWDNEKHESIEYKTYSEWKSINEN